MASKVVDLLGEELERRDRSREMTASAIKGKVLLLYFSAEWCPPCKILTPILRDLYTEEVREKGAALEVVFVSSDTDEEEMRRYFEEKQGDWLAVPFDAERLKQIATAYAVDSIPAIVVVRSDDGQILATDGKSQLVSKRAAAIHKWIAQKH